jgi:hypothetical protein
MGRPSLNRNRANLAMAVSIALGTWLALAPGSASAAHVVHEREGHFDGSEAPAGPFQFVFGVAVDNSGGANDGDLYVGELAEDGGPLAGTIHRFDEAGKYAGVSFSGADTPAGSFSFFQQATFALAVDTIAVDSSAGPHGGDLYVADLEHEVIDLFDESGDYLCQITGGPTPSASECNGSAGSATPDGGLTPTAVAVDESSGDLYVADARNDVIDRFDDSGKYIGQITDPHLTKPSAIDLDSTGALYVVNGGLFEGGETVVKFDAAGSFVSEIDAGQSLSVAVDRRTDHVYLGGTLGNPGIVEFDADGNPLAEFGTGEGELNYASLVVNMDSGRIYGGAFGLPGSSVDFYGPDTIVPDVAAEPVADVQETTASLHGEVAPAGGGDVTLCAFEYGLTAAYGHRVACDQSLPIGGPTAVTAPLSGLTPSTTYHFRLIAANAGVSPYVKGVPNRTDDATFTTPGPPTIDEQSASNVERTGAELRAKINPSGFATQFRFQYVDDAHYIADGGFESAATRSTASSEIGNGSVPLSVGQSVGGLQVGTIYHYRAVASNARGTTVGEGQTFATLPVAAIGDQWAYAHFDSAEIEAKINPLGLDTTCQAQYVGKAAFERSGYAEATSLPCDRDLSGSAIQILRAELTDLQSSSEYHFRFVVSNQSGTVAGPDQSFSTFGIKAFSIEDVDEEGHPYTQAGGHPFATISRYEFTHTMVPASFGTRGSLSAFVKELVTEQPPGRVGYTDGTPRCLGYVVDEERCDGDTQVGILEIEFFEGGGRKKTSRAQFNVLTPEGIASRYGSIDPYTFSDAKIRTGGDYGTTGGAFNLTEKAWIVAATSTVWGVPSDPAHDSQRRCPDVGSGCASNAPNSPLLRNPTSCNGPQTASARAATWEVPGEFVHASTQLPAITGCEKIEFEPSLEWRPTTTAADSPTGLHVNIHVPQNENPEELAVADLKDVVITSAKGLVFNPAAANGLLGCSPAQLDLHGKEPAKCPDGAKVGTVEINTPQLDHPVHGGIYMATPHANPFGSLFALYLAIDDPRTGVVVKLAGKIELDPGDGQLTAAFSRNPQLPMEDLRLDFFDGPRAVLRTPARCGSYVTEATLTPWSAPESGPPATPSDSYEITNGPKGAPCPASEADAPHQPTFRAGATRPTAGAYAPFFVQLRREDGSQQIADFTVTPPPGLTGRLAGLAYCPDAALGAARKRAGAEERADPSCPQASEVGTVTVGVGAGTDPFHAEGKAYLAGAYRGAPLSMAVVVPAVAGPYDLGTVVVRTAMFVEPNSGQLKVESERMPSILQGVPLDVRSILVRLDRPRFTLNPTNCDPMLAKARATSVFGKTVELSEHFQVANCSRLGFAPRLRLRLLGKTHHGAHPSLRAILQMPEKRGANIGRVSVTLPSSLFLDNEHIRGICTRPQFDARNCPPSSIYAYAKASSPLLAKPLKGPVYMRTSDHPLPDLVAALDGQVRFVFGSQIGSARGGIRASLENLPDVPLDRFVLTMRGGAGGLLQNSVNACEGHRHAFVELEGQNGRIAILRPRLLTRCGEGRMRRR